VTAPKTGPAFDVVIAGDVYCDLIFTGLPALPRLGEELYAGAFAMQPGGVFITGAALARLGLRVGLCCWVGDDPFSQFTLDCFAAEGLSTALVQRMAGPLPTLSVSLSLPSDRAFVTYRAARPCPDPAAVLATTSFRHLHIPSLATLYDHPDIAALALERGASISLDCQCCPDVMAQPDVPERIMAAAPAVFLPNLDEALAITRATSAADALESLAAWAPTVITMGGEGALAGRGAERLSAGPLPVHAVDTTGAGDAFAAGYIYGLLTGASLAECLRLATVCGGLSTTAHGGATAAPTLAAVREWLARGW
jgi:sugar/nucleoside kinase (ribokinase family)